MLHKKPRVEKTRSIDKMMKTRRGEKAAENLFKGWAALEKRNVKAGLSLYLHAATLYGTDFRVVQNELSAAKRKGFLPKDFPMPKNARELETILKNL